jgi:hypothetical protein
VRTARTTTARCSSARRFPPTASPRPFPNEQAARAANGGAYPTDLSLITKSRPGWDRHLQPAGERHRRPEYVYSVLTGYVPDDQIPEELKPAAGGQVVQSLLCRRPVDRHAAAPDDDVVTYDDGTPATVDQMARDVSAFLAWAAEPKMEESEAHRLHGADLSRHAGPAALSREEADLGQRPLIGSTRTTKGPDDDPGLFVCMGFGHVPTITRSMA